MYICCNCGAVNADHSHSEGVPSVDIPEAVVTSEAAVVTEDAQLASMQSYHVAEEPPAASAVPSASESADTGTGASQDEEESDDSSPTIPVRKGYVVAGAGMIAICCALALVVGQLPWMGAALTFVAMVGGAIATFGPEIQMKRPRLCRAVLATFGALLVMLVEPVQRVGAMW